MWKEGAAEKGKPEKPHGRDCQATKTSLALIRGQHESVRFHQMTLEVCYGDLLDQDVEVIVNAWNRNIIPWWLLLPQGVSGAIKRRAGYHPFRELARHGAIPLGGAVQTSAGRLPFRAIIHVAGINLFWRSSERAIRGCVRSALGIAREKGYRSIAFPLIGAGTGGFQPERALAIMQDEAGRNEYDGDVWIVRFRPSQ
jgi:O-acetyl-ADP-ribose deacetylase (regulator of RNase III)